MNSMRTFANFHLMDRPVPRRIGLVALATDHTSERDFARLCDPDLVGVYVTRIAYENPTTVQNLRKTGPRLSAAASLILPDEPLDVLAFGCTAASVVLGYEGVLSAFREVKSGVVAVTPVSAALQAFGALGVSRVSLLTPYTRAVTQELSAAFTDSGLEVLNAVFLGLDDDREIARVSQNSILEAAEIAWHPKAEALFVSCTGLQALTCVAPLEAFGQRPVVTSNQAIIWSCLRHCDIQQEFPYGQLFSLPLPISGRLV